MVTHSDSFRPEANIESFSESSSVIEPKAQNIMRVPHCIGKRYDVSECESVQDMLALAKLDWEPRLVTPQVEGISADGWQAICGPNGEAFGFATDKYKPNSHKAHLLSLEPLVKEGHLTPYSVTVWNGGSMIAAQFQSGMAQAEPMPGEKIGGLFTLFFKHDGKGGDRSFLTDIRWICTNQMGQISKDWGRGIKHMGQVDVRYAEHVYNTLTEYQAGSEKRYLNFAKMAEKRLSAPERRAFFAEAFGVEEDAFNRTEKRVHPTVDALAIAYAQTARELTTGHHGSLYHAFQTSTRAITHQLGRSEGRRMLDAIMGDQSTQAYDIACKLLAA